MKPVQASNVVTPSTLARTLKSGVFPGPEFRGYGSFGRASRSQRSVPILDRVGLAWTKAG